MHKLHSMLLRDDNISNYINYRLHNDGYNDIKTFQTTDVVHIMYSLHCNMPPEQKIRIQKIAASCSDSNGKEYIKCYISYLFCHNYSITDGSAIAIMYLLLCIARHRMDAGDITVIDYISAVTSKCAVEHSKHTRPTLFYNIIYLIMLSGVICTFCKYYALLFD